MPSKIPALIEFFTHYGWTQEVYARNAYGSVTPYSSPQACSFCLEGGMLRVDLYKNTTKELGENPDTRAIKQAARELYPTHKEEDQLCRINDIFLHSKKDLIKLLTRANQIVKE